MPRAVVQSGRGVSTVLTGERTISSPVNEVCVIPCVVRELRDGGDVVGGVWLSGRQECEDVVIAGRLKETRCGTTGTSLGDDSGMAEVEDMDIGARPEPPVVPLATASLMSEVKLG
jgi:hypothetical protein